jgi:MFS transporter, DHA1 family, inner membrane transport protein
MNRRGALLLLIGTFIVGNLLCALAPSYSLLMAARIFCALCHGAFFGLGTVVAAALVPREKRTQAIAMMFDGLALANVLGVPFGTMLGNAFDWRKTFGAMVANGFPLPSTLGSPQTFRRHLCD